MTEKKPEAVTRRDFIKGIAVGAVAAAAVSAGIAAVTWPPAVAPPGVVTKTETVTSTATVITTVPPVAPPAEAYAKTITLTVNGVTYTLSNIKNNWTLAWVLREELGLTGTKVGCDRGECGDCTVLIDKRPVLSCQTLAVEVDGKEITTIEGLETPKGVHPIQKAFIEHDGLQCGFCTPGIIMTTKALLDTIPKPSKADVITALDGNLCRCGAYTKVIESVLAATGT